MSKNISMPLISVIVPVYNVEPYIHRCINSIVYQSYQHIEIIVVDDGSPDGCGQICDDYAKHDKRFTIIHKSNGGLASARNAGVRVAKGDYICFVDSDDWIEKDAIEYCINLINSEQETVDVVQYGVATVTSEKVVIKNKREIIKKLHGKEILNNLMISSTKTDTYFSVCRCLFAAHLIKNEKFPEGRINEDIAYKYKVLSRASYMIDSNVVKYFYFQNEGSITTDGFRKKDLDLFVAANELNKLTANEKYGRIKALGEVKVARTSLSLLCKIAYFGFSDDMLNKNETIDNLQRDVRKNLLFLLRSPIPFSRKICACLLSINLHLLSKPLGIYKKILRK